LSSNPLESNDTSLSNKTVVKNLVSLDCLSCNKTIFNSTTPFAKSCGSETVSCTGINPKCYFSYKYLNETTTEILSGCANEEASSKEFKKKCDIELSSKLCPTPNSQEQIVPALRRLGKIDCSYCCNGTALCNTFANGGRFRSIAKDASEALTKGFRKENKKEEALSRFLSNVESKRKNMSGLEKFVANTIYVAMLAF